MAQNRLSDFPGWKNLLRKNFFAGFFVLVPIAVIYWLGNAILGWLWNIHGIVFSFFGIDSHSPLLNSLTFVGAMLVLVFSISMLGWASKLYLGQKALEFLGEVIQRIPVLGTIYSSLDQLLRTVASGGGQQFSRVVMIEYPRKGVWAIAFVTGAGRYSTLPEGFLNVFIPTVPNPTSGFHLIVPESDVKESGLTVEDAFKTILSLGIAQPQAGKSAPR